MTLNSFENEQQRFYIHLATFKEIETQRAKVISNIILIEYWYWILIAIIESTQELFKK